MTPAKKPTGKAASTGKRKGQDAPAAAAVLTPEWQREFLARTRLEKSRIEERFLGKTLENFKIEKNDRSLRSLKVDIRDFIEKFRNTDIMGYVFEGAVGSGKTHFAVAILKEVIARGYTGLYYNMVDLLSDIRATYSENTTLSESELIEEILEPDLLVLDDLGAERTSGWVNGRLYLIVNRRYGSGKPILATTNLNLDELTQKLGD